MRANLDQSNGLTLAEAAVFALSVHMPKEQAQKLVKRACIESRQTRAHVLEVLSKSVDAPIDWQQLKEFERYTGMAGRPGSDDAEPLMKP